MTIRTVTVNNVTEVNFDPDGKNPYFYSSEKFCWIKNKSDSAMYVSLDENCIADADGTAQISSGECGMIILSAENKIYLSGSGDAEIKTSDFAECPFKIASKGGGDSYTKEETDALLNEKPDWLDVVDNVSVNVFPKHAAGTYENRGITYVVDADGRITANGTVEGPSSSFIVATAKCCIAGERYWFSGCPSGGARDKYYLACAGTWPNQATDYGSGVNFDGDAGYIGILINISGGVTVTDLVFEPMLVLYKYKGTEFTPHIPTNKELEKLTSDTYSLTEVNTGKKWIDGKPVYRRVFDAGVSANSGSVVTNVNANDNNIDKMIHSWVVSKGNSSQGYCMTYTNSSGYIIIANSTDNGNVADGIYLVLEYTKTTD